MKCGRKVRKKEFHVDHIVPISKGGSEWELDNLELSCPECNLKKGTRTEPEEFRCAEAVWKEVRVYSLRREYGDDLSAENMCSECGKALNESEIMPNARGIVCCGGCYADWMDDCDWES